ncbi:hypothetical protein D4765_06170 [Subtercola vilae]|uniref:Carbohydrate kinase PfkB domain-containing protein n=1 Tax=Subtercola vilae TaxID=2056433 RepID=A0A4T2C8G3_9MICO|nr:hypothetical protein D4765_06170 [Subtercola vilae]
MCIDENVSEGEAATRLAGSPAVFMNRLFSHDRALDVSILAPYGDDFEEFAAELPLLSRPLHARTLLYRNVLTGTHRRQEVEHAEASAPGDIDAIAGIELERTDLLILSPLLPNFDVDYVREVRRRVPAEAVTVLLPQGYMRTVASDGRVNKRDFVEFAEVLPLVDIAVFSDEDTDDALARGAEWSRRFVNTSIVVTQNKYGATLFRRGAATVIGAPLIGAVDPLATVGAGDVFSAALSVSYVAKRDLGLAVADANEAAAEFLQRSELGAEAPLAALRY